MSFDFLDRRSAERFAELLDESAGGRRHHSRGPADEHLAELVAVGHHLCAARPAVGVEPEFRVGLRAMLLAKAERDGIGTIATLVDAGPDEPAGDVEPGHLARMVGSSRRIRARTAIVIGVAAGAMAVSGISAASENASPGDALYGVKRSTERAQLAVAGSDVARGKLSLDFAGNRFAEAATMPGDSLVFGTVLDDMDADTREGVKLLTGSAVSESDPAPLDPVDAFVASQRAAFSPILDRLSPANRERAQASMTLLEAVHRRAESLRAGLDCGSRTPSGGDELGPTLGGCADGTARATSPDPVTGGTSKSEARLDSDSAGATRPRPERTDPAVAPDATGAAQPGQVPATPAATPADATPSPSTSSAPPDDGFLGGILGGILGG